MARDREHLPLPAAGEPLVRRRRPARFPKRSDRRAHGKAVLVAAKELGTRLKARATSSLKGLSPANIFVVHTAKGRSLDDGLLENMGLLLLAKDESKAMVVSTEDVALNDLQQRLLSYSGEIVGPQYGELDAIERFEVFGKEHRLGRTLTEAPLKAGESAKLDVELWHLGTKEKCRLAIQDLGAALQRLGGKLTDRWIGEGIVLARIVADSASLDKILEWDVIKSIDRRPTPYVKISEYGSVKADDVSISPLRKDAVGVLVVDSGVAALHPLITPVLGDAQNFPAFTPPSPHGPNDEHGHGTAVAAIAIYGDIVECLRSKTFKPHGRLFSARVLDKNAEYDQDTLLETQLSSALEYFLREYPTIRVVNLSFCSFESILSVAKYQLRLAAVLDELAHRFRDREVVFVVPTGNLSKPGSSEIQQFQAEYPHHLFRTDSRLKDPASSALALTVGGICVGEIDTSRYGDPLCILISGGRGNPSSFTRTGPGLNNSVKPELVAYAGDWLIDSGLVRDAGVVSAIAQHVNSGLFGNFTGTSFAAPLVTNVVAQIAAEYPHYSSNLLRALTVHSTQLPSTRPSAFEKIERHEPQSLHVYGYGVPDARRAIRAAANDAWLIAESNIDIDTFQVFEVPEIPESFVDQPGERCLSVTLAFDPPTRASRADSYLGVTMEFVLWRNIDLEDLCNMYRRWDRDECDELEDGVPPNIGDAKGKIDLLPKSRARSNGTVQHAWRKIKKKSGYNSKSPLYLVVICQRKWAPAEIKTQRFGVVISLSHSNAKVDLHAELRAQAKIQARARARVGG